MRRTLSVLPIVLAVLAAASSRTFADQLPETSDRIVAYDISVALDHPSHELHATERVTWRNPSTDTVGELWFHLYLNAFKNTKSTFYRESGGQLRGDRPGRDSWGWVDVTSIKDASGTELVRQLTFEHPDNDDTADQTVAKLVLPAAVPPGGSVTLDLAFTAKLPQVFARTGYKDDFYLVGQWFPKLGVYEPAGMRGRETGGWNCHQFHANSEFYADYGTYRVAITVPSAFKVGATGVRTHEHTNGNGTTTYTYEQADVHDFAWTADPDYLVIKSTFSATKDVTPAEYARIAALVGRPIDEVTLSDVEITVLLQPDHAPQAERHVQAAKAGLKWFGLWYGRYPYKTLTVVDPAPGGGGAAGMEYPTFITAGTSWLFNRWPFDRIRALEAVTVHEFGHQFWYGMVGNNEFEEAWLDEGINSYSTGKVMDLVYGEMAEFLGLKVTETDTLRASNGPEDRYNRILARAWDYTPSNAYGFYSYQKPEIALRTLEGYLGEQTMARVMRTFQERWRFRHPDSQDFFATAQEISGQDLGWFWKEVFAGTGVLDYDVGSVSTRPVQAARGVFDNAKGRETVTEDAAAKQDAKPDKGPYESVVVVRRRGQVVFPVEIAFKFEGQPVERQKWDGAAPTRTFRFVRPQRLEWVDVDPDRKVVLDADWLNNSRRTTGDARAAVKWTARWLAFVQNILAGIGL